MNMCRKFAVNLAIFPKYMCQVYFFIFPHFYREFRIGSISVHGSDRQPAANTTLVTRVQLQTRHCVGGRGGQLRAFHTLCIGGS